MKTRGQDFRKFCTRNIKAVQQASVTKAIHLSSIGAHTDKGAGILSTHHHVENILAELPVSVSIKFMRPVGFYGNLLANVNVIKQLNKGFIGTVIALRYYGIGGLLSGKRGVILAKHDFEWFGQVSFACPLFADGIINGRIVRGPSSQTINITVEPTEGSGDKLAFARRKGRSGGIMQKRLGEVVQWFSGLVKSSTC